MRVGHIERDDVASCRFVLTGLQVVLNIQVVVHEFVNDAKFVDVTPQVDRVSTVFATLTEGFSSSSARGHYKVEVFALRLVVRVTQKLYIARAVVVSEIWAHPLTCLAFNVQRLELRHEFFVVTVKRLVQLNAIFGWIHLLNCLLACHFVCLIGVKIRSDICILFIRPYSRIVPILYTEGNSELVWLQAVCLIV